MNIKKFKLIVSCRTDIELRVPLLTQLLSYLFDPEVQREWPMLIVSILSLTNNRRVAEIQIMEKKLISSS